MATGSLPLAQRAAVVCNPVKVDPQRLRRAVDEAARQAGWAATLWFETSEQDPGGGATAEAIERDVDLVIAAGGDGTVRAVAEGLRGSEVPLGLVPAGTGNLLARNLELPLSGLGPSLRIAFGAGERAIDLGIAEIQRHGATEPEQHVFLVMAGLGLDAKMIKNTSSRLKKAVGWLAYVDGAARSLPEMKPIRLRLRLDENQSRQVSAHTVLIGNCGVLPGGVLLMPDAEPDDGLLDIAILRPRGRLGWLKVWRKITWENGVLRKTVIGRRIIDLSRDARDLLYQRAAAVELRVEQPQEFQLDGDEFGEAATLRAFTEHRALRVKVPA